MLFPRSRLDTRSNKIRNHGSNERGLIMLRECKFHGRTDTKSIKRGGDRIANGIDMEKDESETFCKRSKQEKGEAGVHRKRIKIPAKEILLKRVRTYGFRSG